MYRSGRSIYCLHGILLSDRQIVPSINITCMCNKDSEQTPQSHHPICRNNTQVHQEPSQTNTLCHTLVYVFLSHSGKLSNGQ